MKHSWIIMCLALSGCLGAPVEKNVATQQNQTRAVQATTRRSDDQKAAADISVEVTAEAARIRVNNQIFRQAQLTIAEKSSSAASDRQESQALGESSSSRGRTVLLVIGGLVAGAGLLLGLWLQKWTLGLALMGAGGLVAVVAVVLDWLASLLHDNGLLVLGLLGGCAGLGLVVWLAWRWKRQEITLDAITPAVTAAGQEAELAVRAQVKTLAGGNLGIVRAEVDSSKTRTADKTAPAQGA